NGSNAAMLMPIIVVIITVLLATTMFGMLVRFAVLLVLCTAAPFALACHALPQTDPVARIWWRSFFVCLAIPVLPSFTLQLRPGPRRRPRRPGGDPMNQPNQRPDQQQSRARMPADVDAPDKILYGLTFRQLAILAVAAVIFYAAWRSLHRLVPVPVLLGGGLI